MISEVLLITLLIFGTVLLTVLICTTLENLKQLSALKWFFFVISEII